MAGKFPFSVWNYKHYHELTPDEIDVWDECGLTITQAPSTPYSEEHMDGLQVYLDRAAEKGMKLILNVGGVAYGNPDIPEYAEHFTKVYNRFKGHPALYGFFIGDEPSTKEHIRKFVECARVQHSIAPELHPFINITGNMENFKPEVYGGDYNNFSEWLEYANRVTDGQIILTVDHYAQMINDHGGVDEYFRDAKCNVEKMENLGLVPWANLLLSGHYAFRVPSEADLEWQIHTAAALGYRGIIWFRFYDRFHCPEYRGSPIDEYGYKTEHFYRLLRAQRRFNDQYGDLILKMRRKYTCIAGHLDRGIYPMYTKDTFDFINDIPCYEETILSLFEDEEGKEYLIIANASQQFRECYRIDYDMSKYSLVEVIMNGAQERKYTSGDELHVMLGQMCMLRIDRH